MGMADHRGSTRPRPPWLTGMVDISHLYLTVNFIDGSNRVSEPSEHTGKKIDDCDIK